MPCCAVVGCPVQTGHKIPGLRFYSFPNRWYEADLNKRWTAALGRINPDGSPWRPSKWSVICSQHFVNGVRNLNPTKPGSVPSIFPKVHKIDGQYKMLDPKSDRLHKPWDSAVDQLTCSAPLCGSNKEEHHLFEFPSNINLRRIWLKHSGLDQLDRPIDAPLYLCELHFKFDQFMRTRKDVIGIATLKSNAIPTIFTPYSRFSTQIQQSPDHLTPSSASSHPYGTIDLIETSPTPSVEPFETSPSPSAEPLNTLIHFDGVFEDLFDLLQCKVETFDPLDRLCTVLFDEMKLSAAKDFAKSKRDLITGRSMDDDIEVVGNFITVVLISGLRSGWEQVIACKLTETSAEVTSQVALLEKSISFAESCGLRVLSFSSNLTTNSRLMWSAMGVDVTEIERITHFKFSDHKINVVPDACHLLKSLMAAVHLGIHLSPSLVEDEALPSTHVSSEYVKELWKSDVKLRKSKRMLQHLQENDLEQDASDQITLESALQFFSAKTAKALESAVLSKTIHADALTTAYFCRLVGQWFSICDSKVPELGITTHNIQMIFDFLARVIEVCEGIKVDGCWSPLNSGMIMCTTSLCEVVSILLMQDGFNVVVLHRFCQDAVKNIISQMFETTVSTREEFSKHCLETLNTVVVSQLSFDVDRPSNSISSKKSRVGKGRKTSSAPATFGKRKLNDSETRIISGGSKRSSKIGRVGRPKKASSTSNSPQIELQKRKPIEMSSKASSETPERVNRKNPVGRPRKNAVGRPKKNAVGRPRKNAVGRPRKNAVGRPKKNLSTSKTAEPESRKRKSPFGTPNHISGKRSRI